VSTSSNSSLLISLSALSSFPRASNWFRNALLSCRLAVALGLSAVSKRLGFLAEDRFDGVGESDGGVDRRRLCGMNGGILGTRLLCAGLDGAALVSAEAAEPFPGRKENGGDVRVGNRDALKFRQSGPALARSAKGLAET